MSFFEWVQNLQNFRWDESAVNEVRSLVVVVVGGGLEGKKDQMKKRKEKTSLTQPPPPREKKKTLPTEARQDDDGGVRGRLEGRLGEGAAAADRGVRRRAAAGDEGAPAPRLRLGKV